MTPKSFILQTKKLGLREPNHLENKLEGQDQGPGFLIPNLDLFSLQSAVEKECIILFLTGCKSGVEITVFLPNIQNTD